MRERLDCAILDFGDLTDSTAQLTGVYAKGRLHLHRVSLSVQSAGDVHALADIAAGLHRFDVCLFIVQESNLAWIRQVLLAAQPRLRVPVIGVVHNLKAAAIGDLYNLGMADFVRGPLCIEEVRIRAERLLNFPRPPADAGYRRTEMDRPCAVHDNSMDYGQGHDRNFGMNKMSSAVAVQNADATDDSDVYQSGDAELEAFALASASRCAGSSESFGSAKSKVVNCFERAYLHASLAKSSGNIAMAARGAKKHRRAYWALMRKHNIDAAPYRRISPPDL